MRSIYAILAIVMTAIPLTAAGSLIGQEIKSVLQEGGSGNWWNSPPTNTTPTAATVSAMLTEYSATVTPAVGGSLDVVTV